MIVYFLIEKDLYKLVLFANYININNAMFFDDLTELITLITKVHELKYLRIINIRIVDISHFNTRLQNNTYMVVINNEFQKIWFNKPGLDRLLKAAIAHLWFVTLHPFEDGNGRIGRAISEKAISQGLNSPILFSISKSIEKRRAEYYKALQDAQRKLDISQWLEWFSSIMLEAQENAEQTIQFTVKKVKFFDQHDQNLNERQRKEINRILEEGVEGFKGGMNVKKYLSITNSSKATATRDLQNLVEMNIFTMHGGSRSIRYEIQL
jgi:Fic family protein